MILDKITNLPQYMGLVKQLDRALAMIDGRWDLMPGTYPFDGGRVVVTELQSQPLAEKAFEAHRDYADAMLILAGEETVSYVAFEDMTETVPYDAENDVAFYTGRDNLVTVPAGYFYIVMPGEGHKPGVHTKEASHFYKYIVKLKQTE